MDSSTAYKPFLYWSIMTGIFSFGIYLSWDLGLLEQILAQDRTHISQLVLAVLCLGSAHSGYRSLYLSQQFIQLHKLPNHLSSTPVSQSNSAPFTCLSLAYLSAITALKTGHNSSASTQNNTAATEQLPLLAEVLAERARGSHQVGWFLVGLSIKLGLLGTVVGFIMMLGSLDHLENLDASKVTELMAQMTQGMRTAMNTTLVGLITSMLLGAQYLLLDRTADTLVADTIDIGEQLTCDFDASSMLDSNDKVVTHGAV